MRRREPAPVEPPARLVAFDPAEWLPLVDPAGYRPDDHRNRSNGVPVGPPHQTLEQWRRGEALSLWSQARMDWQKEHGWPGELDVIDLLKQTMRIRRQMAGVPSPDGEDDLL